MATLWRGQLVAAAMAAGDSELGGLAVAVRAGEVVGVSFGTRSASAAATALTCRLGDLEPAAAKPEPNAGEPDEADLALAEDVLETLRSFAAGEEVDLSRIPVSLAHLTPFQRRVVKACQAIKRGKALSYGEVAAAAGSPGAARAVGQVMRSNRTPLLVPCHRVVAAGGKIGGFSAPQGLVMKRRLLELEANLRFN